jgi:serine/threonine protein kinase
VTEPWERITALFGAARLLDVRDRAVFLDAICADNTDLRCEVERLLADAAPDDDFLADPPWAGAFSMPSFIALRAGDVVSGRYRVEADIASGGQALVYRAEDTLLSRPVIVKVMRASGHHSRLLKARFEREMQALSRIDHPGVVGILDVGTLADGCPFLVIQYVNGTSLRQELQGGALAPRRVVKLLSDLGSALRAAHAADVVHQDLKPENILVQRFADGTETVKLIDFGIAKIDRDGVDEGLTTVHIAGTVRYMAPEQFEGRYSAASDIYTLALVVCEMLCGSPDSRALPADLRDTVGSLIDRALAYRPEQRPSDLWQWCEQVAQAIVRPRRSRWRGRWWVPLAALAAITAGVAATQVLVRPAMPAAADRFIVPLPSSTSLAEGPGVVSVSPDGRRIAYAATPGNDPSARATRLWIRPLGSLTAEPLAAAGSAYQPFWSPDSRFIGFVDPTTGALKRIDPEGGPPQTLAERTAPGWDGLSRGAWSSRGTILFSGPDGRLYKVPENGGTAVAVTMLDASRREQAHFWPSFFPDGQHFVYLAYSSPNECVLYATSLDSPVRTKVADVVSTAEYAAGYLFYQREGTLFAQRYDEKRVKSIGDPLPVAQAIRFNREDGRAAFSVSANGVLTYATGGANDIGSLTWHDRAGNELARIGEADVYTYPRLSPDGRRLAVNRRGSDGLWDVWVVDLERGDFERVTFNEQDDYWPIVWSPDGQSIVFAARRRGKRAFDLYRHPVTAAGIDELLFESGDDKQPSGFSPDGKLLLFSRLLAGNKGIDVWALPMDGDRKPFPVVSTPYNEFAAAFSADGRSIAYAADDSGSEQIYVEPFPATGFKAQLTRDGGEWPTWSADGRTIFYSALHRTLWSVDVATSGHTIHGTTPRRLMSRPFLGSAFGSFAVSPSGDRFLLIVPAQHENESSSLQITLNWPALLHR